MKALVLNAPNDIRLLDIPSPEITSPDLVILKVEACGICGSDIRYIAGENPWASHTLGRHVPNPPGMVLGHEFAGVVVETAPGPHEGLVGKRVGAQAFKTCGVCRFCAAGRQNLCTRTMHIGHAQGWGEMEYYPGAYAEYCLAWADLVFELPDNVSFAQSVVRDILGVAVHAVGRGNVGDGSSVLCVGGGPAGLTIALAARAAGAKTVYVRETAPLPRSIAGQYSGIVTEDSGASDGEPVDTVFDTVGTPETVKSTRSGALSTVINSVMASFASA